MEMSYLFGGLSGGSLAGDRTWRALTRTGPEQTDPMFHLWDYLSNGDECHMSAR